MLAGLRVSVSLLLRLLCPALWLFGESQFLKLSSSFSYSFFLLRNFSLHDRFAYYFRLSSCRFWCEAKLFLVLLFLLPLLLGLLVVLELDEKGDCRVGRIILCLTHPECKVLISVDFNSASTICVLNTLDH